MQFRLLGTFEVDADGVDVTPARPKQRALLALLVLRANEVVASDELIEALWGSRPPETAETALRGHVSALRKRLGAERIETRAPGYRLRLLPKDEVDAVRFEQIVAEANAAAPSARAAGLAAALAMFRDEPLSEFRFEEFALREAHRLRELRLATLEEQIDAELELGRELELIPLLESVVADEPYRERPRAQLMLALYRSGRQAEALHVYRDGRRALVEDLGLEPGEALQRLERQILNQAPELAARGVLALGPHRAASVRPEGIVTMLYAEGAARAPTLAVVSQAGGFEVEAREGAVVAAFARARDAVAAAVALERSSRHEMRVGVHSGEAVSTSDVSADPVARGARSIASAAHPGEILLSQAARDLLRETPLAEVDLRDLGEHRLLDLGPPRRVFQLVARELPSEFPPPRSLDTYVTNLPPQPTPLVGRGHMIREIVETLMRPDVRLLTLTGTGGSGKTRVAVHAAAELLDDFVDGVHFVDLAPLTDGALVLPTIARTVRADGAVAADAADALALHLRHRRVLLVLDNFEHLREAAPAVTAAVVAAGATKAIITSRVPHPIAGEHVFHVPPLETPAEGDRVERIASSDAVALFASRARAIRHDFEVTTENAPAVAAICRALDGLPLAIELAATRVGLLPPPALLQRLDARLALLKGRATDAPVRHQTLRATLDWSYELLNEPERRLLARLAVFAGGCTLEAAEAICGDETDVVDALAQLVDANLVRVVGSDEEPRFALLETIREYAREQFERLGDSEQVRRRHADYFLALAEDAEPHLREQPHPQLERLEREHANLRTALDTLAAHEEGRNTFVRLAGCLWRFWYLAGHLREGRDRLEAALDLKQRTPATAKVLLGLTILAGNGGDFETSRRDAEEAIALHRELGDEWGAAYSTHMLGNAIFDAGDLHTPEPLYQEAEQALRQLGDPHSALLVTRNLARLLEARGDAERAAALHEKNLRVARKTENPRIVASTLGALAMIDVRHGRFDDAVAKLRESLLIHTETGDRLDTAVDVCRAAHVLAARGRTAVAARMLAAFDNVRPQVGVRAGWVAELNARTAEAIARDLGDNAATQAAEEARTLELDDAVALAVAELASV